MTRELESQGHTGLPAELQFHIHARWGSADDWAAKLVAAAPSGAEADADDGPAIRPGLSLLAPLPLPLPSLRLADCRLIGNTLFREPLKKVWHEYIGEALKRFAPRQEWSEPRRSYRLEGELADVVSLRPLALDPNWSTPVASLSDDGRHELSCGTGWSGSPCLWTAAAATGLRHPLRAIIDDDCVTLRVRTSAPGKFDLDMALGRARLALERKVGMLATLCAERSTQMAAGVHAALSHSQRQHRQGPTRFISQPSSPSPR